jgi:hypothetical protein
MFKLAPFKTRDKKAEFTRRLFNIVKGNRSLNGRFRVSFEEFGAITHIFITNIEGNGFDITPLMSKREYANYIDLLNWWKQ